VKEDKELSEAEKKRQKRDIKKQIYAAYKIAADNPELLKAAKEFERKFDNKKFSSVEDAEDFWENALSDNEQFAGLSTSEQGAVVQVADDTLVGEVASQKSEVQSQVDQILGDLGVQVADDVLASVVDESWRKGFNTNQIRDLLRGQVDSQLGASADNTGFKGTIGQAAADLSEWSKQNGFTISQQDADQMLSSVAFGEQTLDQVKSNLRQTYMVGAYPAWADQINAGMDIYQLASPYRSVAQKMLGRTDIGMDDPVMKEMMQVQGADGKFTQRPLWQTERYVRNLDEWQGTDDAASTYATSMSAVGKMFGFG